MIQRTEVAVMRFTLLLATGIDALKARVDRDDADGDRGDVPGWVMITLMSAIVVIGLLAVFKGEVYDAVSKAFASIKD